MTNPKSNKKISTSSLLILTSSQNPKDPSSGASPQEYLKCFSLSMKKFRNTSISKRKSPFITDSSNLNSSDTSVKSIKPVPPWFISSKCVTCSLHTLKVNLMTNVKSSIKLFNSSMMEIFTSFSLHLSVTTVNNLRKNPPQNNKSNRLRMSPHQRICKSSTVSSNKSWGTFQNKRKRSHKNWKPWDSRQKTKN